jgi:hypothetical protein
VTGFSAATILVFAIASPLRAQGIEVCSGRLDKIAVSDRRRNRSSDLDRHSPSESSSRSSAAFFAFSRM